LLVVVSMRIVANPASLLECRLVQYVLLPLLRLLRVARQANLHSIRLWQSRLAASVRAVAIRAISRRSRVLDLGRFNLLGLFSVARNAQRFPVCLRQNNYSVFGRRMTNFTLFFRKRRMREPSHQLWRIGLVRVVALHTIGRPE